MAKTQVTTFLQNQERYDIGFKNTGVIEYGVFDNKGLIMAKTQVTTFLQNQERYDIGFKNTGVIEYGVFDNKGLAESVDNQRDPLSGNTDIIDSDLSASQTEFSITDLTTGDKIFSGFDHDDFEAKIRELAAAYQKAGNQDA